MALMAEEVVQEWLNRQGYFTIRGARLGVHELDLLAVRHQNGAWTCRHIEVQVSHRPMSYLSALPLTIQKATGRKANAPTKRSESELQGGIGEWIAKKFDHPDKVALKQRLAPGLWSREVVVHKLYAPQEALLLEAAGVRVHTLAAVLEVLRRPGDVVRAAGGEALLDLMWVASNTEAL
jgi:hypothetical protein